MCLCQKISLFFLGSIHRPLLNKLSSFAPKEMYFPLTFWISRIEKENWCYCWWLQVYVGVGRWAGHPGATEESWRISFHCGRPGSPLCFLFLPLQFCPESQTNPKYYPYLHGPFAFQNLWKSTVRILLIQLNGHEFEKTLGNSKGLPMLTAAMKLKDSCPLEEKLWST